MCDSDMPAWAEEGGGGGGVSALGSAIQHLGGNTLFAKGVKVWHGGRMATLFTPTHALLALGLGSVLSFLSQ